MKTPIRLRNFALAAAIAAGGLLAAGPALAAAARTNGPVTVFDGPGYGYRALGNIGAAQNVEVEQCEAAFCFVTFGPLAGWAPEASLDMQIGAAPPPSTDFSIGIGVGEEPPPPEPPRLRGPVPPPGPAFPRRPRGRGFASAGDVCFFDRLNYRGASFCMDAGEAQPFLGDWANTIRSIDNPDGFDVRVCMDPGFRRCRVYTSSARSLGRYDMAISSALVE